MNWKPAIGLIAGFVLLTAACGDDDNGGLLPVSRDSAPGGSGDAGNTGSARITVGDESFVFDVTCSFGTGIIRGTGTNDDGKPAWTQLSMPIDDRGQPLDDVSDVTIDLLVGTNTFTSPADYRYRVGPGDGGITSYQDDGENASGMGQFAYDENQGAREGLTDGALVDGSFEASCP